MCFMMLHEDKYLSESFVFHLSILIPSLPLMYLCSNRGVRNGTQKRLQLHINVILFHHDNNNTKTNGIISIIIIMGEGWNEAG
jgi:hypothetical protein